MGFAFFFCLFLLNWHALPLISHAIISYELLASFQWENFSYGNVFVWFHFASNLACGSFPLTQTNIAAWKMTK